MIEYSEQRYLRSKKSVDDRALNRGVLATLKDALETLGRSPRVLEVGAGVGTMLPRLASWGILTSADYTFLERDATSLAEAKELGAPSSAFTLDFVAADALAFAAEPAHAGRFDLIVANAVLDLMDLATAVPALLRLLAPGGSYWFSLNFDGETIFLPELPEDAALVREYHRTMDERVLDGRPSGDSRSGRHLLELLPKLGAAPAAAGSSDWVVLGNGGAYVEDEAYFLHHIVHTVDTALAEVPAVAASELAAWVTARHAQVERAELIYIAHQLDVCGRVR